MLPITQYRIFFLLLAFFRPAAAHDLYLLPDSFRIHSGATLRVSVHNGDSFPASEVAPVIVRLRDAQLLGKGGTSPVEGLQVSGNEVIGNVLVPGGGNLWLSVRTVPNLIELAPDKFLAYLKEEGLDDVVKWRAKNGETVRPGRERYSKYAKSLLQEGSSDGFYEHPLGFPIEIIPMDDPYAARAGGVLRVRVLFRGKPASGFQLEAAWTAHGKSKTTVIGRTDALGNIAVPLCTRWQVAAAYASDGALFRPPSGRLGEFLGEPDLRDTVDKSPKKRLP